MDAEHQPDSQSQIIGRGHHRSATAADCTCLLEQVPCSCQSGVLCKSSSFEALDLLQGTGEVLQLTCSLGTWERAGGNWALPLWVNMPRRNLSMRSTATRLITPCRGKASSASSGVPSRLSSLHELRARTAGWVTVQKGHMSCDRACHALPRRWVQQEDTAHDGCGDLQEGDPASQQDRACRLTDLSGRLWQARW